MGTHPIRPARFWYWVAGAAVVAAVLWLALSLFLGFRSLSRQVEGFQRVPIPGQAGPQVCGLLAAELPPLSQPSGCGERPTTAALYDDLLGAGVPPDADRTMAGILR